MAKPDPAATVADELTLLLRSYPEVSLADLAAALRPPPASSSGSPDAPGDWSRTVEPILRCAAAFGDSRQFASKRDALAILSAELGVPSTWTNLRWDQLPSVAAAALLRLGPGTAQDLMRRHRLRDPHPAGRRPSPSLDETVQATVGILRAKHT
jgi:hypothetical protein